MGLKRGCTTESNYLDRHGVWLFHRDGIRLRDGDANLLGDHRVAVGVRVSSQERSKGARRWHGSAYYDTIVEMRQRQWRRHRRSREGMGVSVGVGMGKSVTINGGRRCVGSQTEDATLLLPTGIRFGCGRLDG